MNSAARSASQVVASDHIRTQNAIESAERTRTIKQSASGAPAMRCHSPELSATSHVAMTLRGAHTDAALADGAAASVIACAAMR